MMKQYKLSSTARAAMTLAQAARRATAALAIILLTAMTAGAQEDVSDADGLLKAFSAQGVSEINVTADITGVGELSLNRDLTINLNGYTISGDGLHFEVGFDCSLTINGGGQDGSVGNIISGNANGPAIYNYGTVTLSNVNITTNSDCAIDGYGTVTLSNVNITTNSDCAIHGFSTLNIGDNVSFNGWTQKPFDTPNVNTEGGNYSGTVVATVTVGDVTHYFENSGAALAYIGNNAYNPGFSLCGIKTAADWDLFCDLLEAGETFSGKTVRLGADISVTRMAGSADHAFTGTFDGQGHTLTVQYGTPSEPVNQQFVAPFPNVTGGATFRNLTIAGSIYNGYATSDDKGTGGLIGHLFGSVTVEHCVSTVTVNAARDRAGGFVGLCEHAVTFTDCVSSATVTCTGSGSGFVGWSRNGEHTIAFYGCLFDGKVLKQGTVGSGNGSFVGWKGFSKTVTITNCIAAPATDDNMATDNSATFCRYSADTNQDNGETHITNCYYTQTLGTAQGMARHTVTAGTDVTVAHAGVATHYATSGITAYKATGASAASDLFIAGLLYNNNVVDVLYAGSGDVVSLTLSNTGAPLGYQYGYTASAGTLSGSTLTMPDANVTVNVDTETLRSDGQQHVVSCMTADGTTWTYFAIALDGHEAVDEDGYVRLAAGTYYVGTDITYANEIRPTGNITLILADGKTMTLNGNMWGINGGSNLTIYGQSLDAATAGTLRYDGTSYGIYMPNYVQHSGNVSITTSGSLVKGIAADVTLRGGTLTISANGNNAFAIYGKMHSILGGHLTATATGTNAIGIYASATGGTALTLGWTRPADRITASSISTTGGGTVAVVAYGQALTDGSGHIYTGILSASVLSGFAAETTLRPYSNSMLFLADDADNTAIISKFNDQTYNVTLAGRTLYKDGSWNTLCLPFSVSTASGTLSGDNVQAMTLNTETSGLTGSTLTLNFTDATGQTIPAGTPFIIKWDNTGVNIENPVFEGVTVSNATNDATVEGVLTFTGTYAPVSIGSEGDNTKLYLGAANKLYYPNAAMTIGTHRAYFQLLGDLTAGEPVSSSNARQIRAFNLNFGDDEATGIVSAEANSSFFTLHSSLSEWYTLDGRRLDGQPTAKGLYIHGGKKVAIK